MKCCKRVVDGLHARMMGCGWVEGKVRNALAQKVLTSENLIAKLFRASIESESGWLTYFPTAS